MKPTILLLMLFLSLLVGCARHPDAAGDAADAKPEPVAVEMATATVRPLDTTVSAQGTLTPGQGASARVAPVTAGRIREIRVREGDRVRAGQVVAVLDDRAAAAQTRSAEAALRAAEAQARQGALAAQAAASDQTGAVRQARLALRSAQLDADAQNKQAANALASAQTDLQKTRAGARPEEIAQAEQAVRQAQATRDRAATERDRLRLLFEKGVSARRQVEDAETAFSVAEAALETARQQARLVRAGARAEDIRAAELRVAAAREALSAARASGTAKVAQARDALRQAERGTLSVAAKKEETAALAADARAKSADAAAQRVAAGQTVLRAPISGVVTRRLAEPGDMADPSAPVVEIAATRALNVLARLPAEDGLRVRPGMPARVHPADAPDRIFAGQVLSVGQVDPETNLLSVRIALAPLTNTSRLRAGAFVVADIVVRHDAHAVVVPRQAVLTREGQSIVFVVGADNVAHQRTVEVGPEQGDVVSITKGLAADARVVRLGQYELEDGAPVKTMESAANEK